jgi:hypothetical protein
MISIHSLITRCKPLALTGAVVAAVAVVPATAGAQTFGITPNSLTTSVSSNQAGAHADLTTGFMLNTDELGNPVDQLKDVTVNLPSGIVGNPQAVPQCTDREFQNFDCPNDAQVGILNTSIVVTPAVSTTLLSVGPTTTLQSTLTPCTFCLNEDITVDSTAGIDSGDYLTVGSGATAEQVVVASVVDATTLNLSISGSEISNTHNPGETVASDTIQVDSTSGFNATPEGDDNLVTIGTGANAEQARLEFAPSDAHHLILFTPLTNPHSAGEPVVHQASMASVPIAVFNMQPDPGHVATLDGSLLIAKINIDIDVRNDGSYGLTANIHDISSLLTLGGASLTLWGVPGDPSHDGARCGELGFSCGPSNAPQAAFMTNPTNCGGGPLTTTASVDSWQNPDQPSTASATQTAPTGCDQLSFAPGLKVSPDTTQADTPAGYDVDLTVPQNQDPFGLATPDVQNVSVSLPSGTALSAAVANGLQGCSDAQFAASSCPDASKVGTVSIKTPVLPDQLTGSVWIGSPTASQTFRMFLIATADNVTIRLTGLINPNSSTGQLTTVFSNNPQLPFSELNLSLFGGPLAPLANPQTCGTATTTSSITPYGAAAATPSSSFDVTGCPSGAFAPTFTAGTTNPTAGAFSPFSLTFSRQDGQSDLSSITATLPPGLFAKIKGVPLCANAQASAGTCSSASQVGTATVGSGSGSHPLFLSGPVYLTGPYNGGAYGLATVVPAIAGPYNLGTVVVRQSLRIDPNDAHVTAVSDPFPTILDGVPLRIKTINLNLDRPGFIINPTSCAPSQIAGTISSVGGAAAPVSSRFQVAGCSSLSFVPTLGINLSGKGATTSGKHPTLVATLKAPSQEANLESAKVTLPLSLALDPKNSQVVCSVAAAAALNCPAKTIVGKASAVSPLLPDPLNGNVYLVQGIRTNSKGQQIKTLPSLLIPLSGDVALTLHAKTSVDGAGRLISTFSGIPDAAVSNFKLTINGGSKGILVITGSGRSICKSAQTGSGLLGAHSGEDESLTIPFGTPCNSKAKKTHGHKQNKRKHAQKKSGRR